MNRPAEDGSISFVRVKSRLSLHPYLVITPEKRSGSA